MDTNNKYVWFYENQCNRDETAKFAHILNRFNLILLPTRDVDVQQYAICSLYMCYIGIGIYI